MRCPECKAQVPDHLSLCPVCGEMVEDTRPIRARSKELEELEQTQPLHRPNPKKGPASGRVC
jgi:hypothetical protein